MEECPSCGNEPCSCDDEMDMDESDEESTDEDMDEDSDDESDEDMDEDSDDESDEEDM